MGPDVLIRFEVANFRSILDPVELSMVAVDRDRQEASQVEKLGQSLLSVAGIYGPNASGKSNVLAALGWLRRAVEQSLRFWDDGIPVEQFALGDRVDRRSEFTVESVVDGVRFEYVLELDAHAVHYEGLFHYPERKRRRIFEREGSVLRWQRGLGGLGGTRELMTARTLVLSIARRFDEPLLEGFTRLLLEARTLGVPAPRAGGRFSMGGASETLSWFDDDPLDGASSRRAQALALLKLADLGIDDVRVERHVITPSGDDAESGTLTFARPRLLHRSAGSSTALDFTAESHGTQTWFRLIGPVLTALDTGSLVLFDELDASLHPTLSAELIRLFHDPTTNPRRAQLVFASHDTSLLGHLNRDEIWLTEKDERGATRLGALAEFAGERVRRSRDLERSYLSGRFGALPEIDRVAVLRALGLVG